MKWNEKCYWVAEKIEGRSVEKGESLMRVWKYFFKGFCVVIIFDCYYAKRIWPIETKHWITFSIKSTLKLIYSNQNKIIKLLDWPATSWNFRNEDFLLMN